VRVRKEIRVSGIVQGVGFRPYVYRLATERRLEGSISNSPAGVTIEIQGPTELVEDFVARLPAEAPALAQITRVFVRELPCRESEEVFEILPSESGEPATAHISPDVALCADCLREMLDPADRRYLYPFINCTNCGPRFTIVRAIPYDRASTSMSVFEMCPACRAEYEDPRDRRFHAQPNACWKCGPQLEFWDSSGAVLESGDPIAAAVERLQAGKIVAIKGLGGFHVAVDATNALAVERLRERKHRAEKPFAVMVPDLETAKRFCKLDSESERVLCSRERPIVLVSRAKPCGANESATQSEIAECVAPNQSDLGIFLPYTPVHHLLFAKGKFVALVMTSANLSEEPIAIANDEAVQRLGGIADYFLVHNREILLRCDDSVVRVAAGHPRQTRRSRGYVPAAIPLHKELPQILAVGGELKNTICLTRGRHAFLSQHIGDLENVSANNFFDESAAHLSQVLEIAHEIVAHDLHPGYFSTKWARERRGMKRVAVQHHHAHIAACMAENQLDGEVIGIALDGTGYGTDGHIWGGEILIAGYAGFRRAAQFEYVPLPGGEAAIREPWRMAVSYLAHAFGDRLLSLDLPFVRGLDRRKTELILQMIAKGIRSPLTSSCGRLFDAVAAVISIRNEVSYEAQAAIELEMLARQSDDAAAYPFDLTESDGRYKIAFASLFNAIATDLRREVPAATIARRFHNGLAEALLRVAILSRDGTSLSRVCLSGGSFNNVILLESLLHRLEAHHFEVFTHSKVPTGDGGLSLGQALVAAHAVQS
jgi:hydrogenase maturation protein HypF